MIFTKIPQNFASYQEPILLAFDMEQQVEQLDIMILRRDGSEIGRKRMYGVQSAQIDIAPYVQRAAECTAPGYVATADFFSTGASVDVMVQVGSTRTPMFTFLAARVESDNSFMLLGSQISHRVIAYDEFDTIGYVNKDGGEVKVVIEGHEGTDIVDELVIESTDVGQLTIAVTPQDFRKAVRRMVVRIFYEGVEQECIEYEVRENMAGARRIVWLNSHLSPECYTFPLRKSILVEATRRRMSTLWGSEAAEVEHENELKLISAYEPQEQLKALSGIISSPKVWEPQGYEVQAVDLLTERVLLTPGSGMGFIEVDLRAAEEGVELW